MLYVAIDLHSDNNFLAAIDEKDRRLCEKRLKNEMSVVLTALAPFKERIHAIAVESTFNWRVPRVGSRLRSTRQ